MSNFTKKTVMIVEDDIFVMDIYTVKMAEEGFNLVSASNGAEAIKKLEEGVRPDLILLDIVMPYMDGLSVLKKIKGNKDLNDIPVVLLTNLGQKEEIQKSLDLGARDYLIKSHFTPSEVMEKIHKYLSS